MLRVYKNNILLTVALDEEGRLSSSTNHPNPAPERLVKAIADSEAIVANAYLQTLLKGKETKNN